MAKFKILTSFKMTRRGLLIVGDIIEGEIQVGNWITFKHDKTEFRREIAGIEMVDKILERIAHVGILLKYANDVEREEFAELRLEEQIAEIEK